MAFVTLDDPRRRNPPKTFSLWALGFRPFYLLAATFAALAVPVWIVSLKGGITLSVGLTLIAVSDVASLPPSAAVHALAIGATGSLILGMITRTALGHTGRLLEANWVEIAAYGLIQCAAASRVLTLVALPAADFE